MDLAMLCEYKAEEYKSKIMKCFFDSNMKAKNIKVTLGSRMYALQDEGLEYNDGTITMETEEVFKITIGLENTRTKVIEHEVNLEIVESRDLFEWDIIVEVDEDV